MSFSDFVEYRYNPLRIQQDILNQSKLEYPVVDASNPFMFLMEMGISTSAANMRHTDAAMRRLYPNLAQSEEDLYLHMSDEDYIDRFASPAKDTIITFFFSLDEILDRAVPVPGSTERRLVIPRHTQVSVEDTLFSMQYPLEIRVLGSGRLQCVYDITSKSPLKQLATSTADWTVVRIGNLDQDFLRINIPFDQFDIKSIRDTVTDATGYTKTITFNDQFYYARVYTADSTNANVWTEIATTHTDQVFNPNKLTAVLQVVGQTVKVHIPPVYFLNGMVKRSIRIDVYTTLGVISMSLSNYSANAFVVKWQDYDTNNSLNVYTAPLTTFPTMSVMSTETISGGSFAISLNELRDRVINNALGSLDYPITPVQIKTALYKRGYSIVKYIDNLPQRTYLATRELPPPSSGASIAPAGSTISMLQHSFEGLKELPYVRDNLNRLTILPETLYTTVSGIIRPVTLSEIQDLNNMPIENRINYINNSSFMYSPFHYVWDINDNRFDSRGYYLQKPLIDNRRVNFENDTVNTLLNTRSMELVKVDDGYQLLVSVRTDETIRGLDLEQITVFLSFRPNRETQYAFMTGSYVGVNADNDDYVYQFDISSTWDINEKDELLLNSFRMIDPNTDRKLVCGLTQEFDIYYFLSNYNVPNIENTVIDNRVPAFMLPENALSNVGVAWESFTVHLGTRLANVWSASRSTIGSIIPALWETDVPARYTSNVYEYDGNGIKIEYIDGEVIYTKLHSINDPILTPEGDPVYLHRAGEPKLDEDGNFIPLNPRGMLRQADLLLFDGKYVFATHPASVSYRESIGTTIVKWLENDIVPMSELMLEETRLLLYPRKTLGRIEVMVDGGDLMNLDAEQSFVIRYFITEAGFRNTELRNRITQEAKQAVIDTLANTQVSMDSLIDKLRSIGSEVSSGVSVSGLGGRLDLTVFTVVDESSRAVIKKNLRLEDDNRISVVDAVVVEFSKHARDI